MSQPVKRKLVVCGGNGFLGSRICKVGVARGWDVTSVSRSGEPRWDTVTSSPQPPDWSQKVTWAKGNILYPSTYTQYLKNADAVIHSMGILLEADYKGVIQGKVPIREGLHRAFSSVKLGSKNPLDESNEETDNYGSQEKDGQITYELMNRDSAILLARESNKNNVSAFVYVSAAAGAPILPARYIITKRAAESTISKEFPGMRNIFIRPGMLYDNSRSITIPLAAMSGMGWMVNSLVGGRLTWLMGAGGTKPLKADTVAEAVAEAVDDGDVSGPIEVPSIEELATRAWRKRML